MTNQRIQAHFQESAELKQKAAAVLAGPISQAVELMFMALSNGNKILACGNGGSAGDCQHFAAELVMMPRPWAERHYNIVRWTRYPRGGHYAAIETPAEFVADLRGFARHLSGSGKAG